MNIETQNSEVAVTKNGRNFVIAWSIGLIMVTVLLTVIQSTISLYIYDIRGEQALSSLFDKVSLVIFMVTYIIANLVIPWAASV